jgi:hypothetical protein
VELSLGARLYLPISNLQPIDDAAIQHTFGTHTGRHAYEAETSLGVAFAPAYAKFVSRMEADSLLGRQGRYWPAVGTPLCAAAAAYLARASSA